MARPGKPSAKPTPDPQALPGIRELRWVPADQLADNPANWRRHPKRQLDALAASLKANGWAGALLLNETTGRLIDGHARKALALATARQSGSNLVPVLVGCWSPEQERRVLATLDPISAMAETDAELLRKLTAQIDADLQSATEKMAAETATAFQSVNRELAHAAELIDFGAPAAFFPSEESEGPKEEAPKLETPKGGLPGVHALKTRAEIPYGDWAPHGPWDLPCLRPDMLAPIPEPVGVWLGPKDTTPCEHYLYVWGSTALEHTAANCVVCFYTADERFDPMVWDSPNGYTESLLRFGVGTVISPNYSCYDGAPLALDLWQTYRSRWLSRYWQEAGLRVIPDLMLGNLDREQTWGWRFAGIPRNAPAVALQTQQKGGTEDEAYYRARHRQLLKVLDLLAPESLLVYHGPNLPEWFIEKLPSNLHVVRCVSFMSQRAALMKDKHYIR